MPQRCDLPPPKLSDNSKAAAGSVAAIALTMLFNT